MMSYVFKFFRSVRLPFLWCLAHFALLCLENKLLARKKSYKYPLKHLGQCLPCCRPSLNGQWIESVNALRHWKEGYSPCWQMRHKWVWAVFGTRCPFQSILRPWSFLTLIRVLNYSKSDGCHLLWTYFWSRLGSRHAHYLVLVTTLKCRHHYSHFIDQSTEIQRAVSHLP